MPAPFPQPLTGIAAPLLADNVDTDTIIPSREMRSTGRTGLADGLFAPWRYADADARAENPEFVLNQSSFRDARIIAAGANFGCGSSREHAVWALAAWGVRAVLAESFAPIFAGNCVRNGLLPAALHRDAIEALAGEQVTVDLATREVRHRDEAHRFELDEEAHAMLAKGLDAVDLTLEQSDAIERWTARDREARPWIYLENAA